MGLNTRSMLFPQTEVRTPLSVWDCFGWIKKVRVLCKECAHDTDCVGDTEMQLRIGWYMIQEEKANDYMLLDDTPVWVQIRKKIKTTPMELL